MRVFLSKIFMIFKLIFHKLSLNAFNLCYFPPEFKRYIIEKIVMI